MLYFCLKQWKTSVQKSNGVKSQTPVGAVGVGEEEVRVGIVLPSVETVTGCSFSFWCASTTEPLRRNEIYYCLIEPSGVVFGFALDGSVSKRILVPQGFTFTRSPFLIRNMLW